MQKWSSAFETRRPWDNGESVGTGGKLTMPNEKEMLLSRRTALKGGLAAVVSAGWHEAVSESALEASSGSRGNGMVVVDGGTTIFVPSEEPRPVQRAAQDLADDFNKVFGKRPQITHDPQAVRSASIVIGAKSTLPHTVDTSALTEPESFLISTVSGPGRAAHAVYLVGADARGTMYAIYHFAEEFLGVDPLYYWTDNEPVRRSQVELPANLHRVFAPPLFRYRGFFLNDEDLLTGWAPDSKAGIALSVWNKVFETILRLKGNMVCPGTWIFPDAPQIALAGERGLAVAQHHAIPLGVNVARWPAGVTYNYSTHPEIIEQAWKNAAHSYAPGVQILWAVGLRGLSDISYASMDPSVRGNNQALGSLIGKAVARQMQIVREIDPKAEFIFDTWAEGAALVRSGDLVIPPEVHTVWADTGYGYLMDNGDVAAGEGAYYHTAMMNGKANQLTEMVPVERIYSELGRYIQARATYYLLINTSDIRPVPMTTKAVMDVAWRGVPEGGAEAPARFFQRWAKEQFGVRASAPVAEVYEDYFKAPAHFGDPIHEYGDQLYHTEGRRIMQTSMIDAPLYSLPSQSPRWEQPRISGLEIFEKGKDQWLARAAQHQIEQCGGAQQRWDSLWNKAVAARPLVEENRLPFYQAHVLTMITINRESNRALWNISRAVQAMLGGKSDQARTYAAEVLVSLDAVRKAQQAAEYGKWKNWYRGDWLVGVYRTQQVAEVFSKFLSDPLTHLSPPVFWNGWEGYYHIMQYEGTRSVDVSKR